MLETHSLLYITPKTQIYSLFSFEIVKIVWVTLRIVVSGSGHTISSIAH